jgi:hypothetical protein
MEDEIFDHETSKYFTQDNELTQLEYEDLIKKLEDNTLLEEVTQSTAWRVMREAWRRIYLRADVQLSNIDPTNSAKIMAAQITKRFYKDVLASTIKKIKEDGKAAFEQAEERGLLNKMMLHLKKDL